MNLRKFDKPDKNAKHRYRPDLYYSAFWKIDFEELAARGIRNLIIDVDSTIALQTSYHVDPLAAKTLRYVLETGLIEKACLVSNTMAGKRKEKRLEMMAQQFGIPFVAANFFHRKPNPKPFLKGLEYMDANPEETAVIGDQIFTDIQGGNRLGMFTILVKPLGPVHWTTVVLFRRFRERRILKKLGIELCDKD